MDEQSGKIMAVVVLVFFAVCAWFMYQGDTPNPEDVPPVGAADERWRDR